MPSKEDFYRVVYYYKKILCPRVSPKFMLCDAIEKAVVFRSSSPAAVGAASWRAGQAKSKEGVMVHARFNISGELERESRKGIQIQNLKCFSLGPSKARWFPSGSQTRWAFTVMCHISLFRAWWPCLPGQRLRSLETLEHHIRFLALPPISHTRSSSSRQWIVVGSTGGAGELTQDSEGLRRRRAMDIAPHLRAEAFSR
jgi:hypothetical protein